MYATWEERQVNGFMRVPVIELQYNKAPAVAPLGVLAQADGWDKLQLSLEVIEKHKKILLSAPHFAENIRSVSESRPEYERATDVEAQLYDGFVGDRDRLRVEAVRNANERDLADFNPDFSDERLAPLLLHFKARNYPRTLTEQESREWEAWRTARIQRQLPDFMKSLQTIASTESDESKQFILQELQLWAESVIPIESDEADSRED